MTPLNPTNPEPNYVESYGRVAKDAASRGEALQAGLRALTSMATSSPIIQKDEMLRNQIFFASNYRVCLKGPKFKQNGREFTLEQESITNSLLRLMSNQAIVGSFKFKKANIERFGINIADKEKALGLDPATLSKQIKKAIEMRLSKPERLFLRKYNSIFQQSPSLKKNYERFLNEAPFIKEPIESSWETQSFKELQGYYLRGRLDSETLIGTSETEAMPLRCHLLSNGGKGSSLGQALSYNPAIERMKDTFLLAPDLSENEVKEAYHFCSKFKFHFTGKKNERKDLSFNLLQLLYLEQGRLPSAIYSSFPDCSKLEMALESPWKILSPKTVLLESGTLSTLRNFTAQPYLKEMILMQASDQDDREISKASREIILERLTSDSIHHAILAGELQMLDLHGKNLGAVPESTPDYESFKDTHFTLFGKKKDFAELALLSLRGELPPETQISYFQQGIKVQGQFKDLPRLQTALKGRWRLIFFDTDYTLAEDNTLQQQLYLGTLGHLIPLRSVLLETDWKDTPLPDEVIQKLVNCEERNRRAWRWICKESSPIYHRISVHTKQRIKEYLTPLLETYSLSEERKVNNDATTRAIGNRFSKELCNLQRHREFWRMIEADLAVVKVYTGDTWDTIGKRHHLPPDAIREINVSVNLAKADSIRITYDLTSAKALGKRKIIAKQFFPHLTSRQQEALRGRQENMKKYLNHFLTLSNRELPDDNFTEELQRFLRAPYSPLTSLEKRDFLTPVSTGEISIHSLREKFMEKCCPTYFNLMKSMYPLLADVYALNLAAASGDHRKAGAWVGCYKYPIELAISEVREKYLVGSNERELAEIIQAKVNTTQTPSFFGCWNR